MARMARKKLDSLSDAELSHKVFRFDGCWTTKAIENYLSSPEFPRNVKSEMALLHLAASMNFLNKGMFEEEYFVYKKLPYPSFSDESSLIDPKSKRIIFRNLDSRLYEVNREHHMAIQGVEDVKGVGVVGLEDLKRQVLISACREETVMGKVLETLVKYPALDWMEHWKSVVEGLIEDHEMNEFMRKMMEKRQIKE
eukprot:TRINITY_DN5004_c0_g2_i3.p1 TRINITY_DN5004_c0_g2~~TRINITY_DN5004_c0_g2_i3.p1  ORF type:complete len:196 (+),score=36.09 TRINITY_DN5004_c0_g2_i3:933-1520(+)